MQQPTAYAFKRTPRQPALFLVVVVVVLVVVAATLVVVVVAVRIRVGRVVVVA